MLQRLQRGHRDFSSEYRVIAIDPRGQGYSAKTVDGNDYLTHGRDVAGLIDALGLKDIVLIGWSTEKISIPFLFGAFLVALHIVTIGVLPICSGIMKLAGPPDVKIGTKKFSKKAKK